LICEHNCAAADDDYDDDDISHYDHHSIAVINFFLKMIYCVFNDYDVLYFVGCFKYFFVDILPFVS